MGTNFYYRKENNKCEHCGRFELEEYHIGKRSGGWNFLFSDSKYKTARGWKKFIKANPDNIFNEYDEKVSLEDMLETMEWKGKEHIPDGDQILERHAHFWFKDSQGYDFTRGEFW